MKNLAGVKDCDKTIERELTNAGAEIKPFTSKGEVPFSIIGKVGNWILTRAWYYWIAVPETEDDNGLPLDIATEMHEKKYPKEMFEDCNIENYGWVIRAGGDCTSPAPKDSYVAQPIYDSEFISECKALGIKIISGKSIGMSEDETEYPDLNRGEIAKLCNEGKIKSPRYVNCYHIDTQEGLNEFVRVIKSLTEKQKIYDHSSMD